MLASTFVAFTEASLLSLEASRVVALRKYDARRNGSLERG